MRHVRHAHVRRANRGAVVVRCVKVDDGVVEWVELRARERARRERVDRIGRDRATRIPGARVAHAGADHLLYLERVRHGEHTVAVGVSEDAVGRVGARGAGLQASPVDAGDASCRPGRREDEGAQVLPTALREAAARRRTHQQIAAAGDTHTF